MVIQPVVAQDGEKPHGGGIAARGERDAGVSRCTESRGNAGHEFITDPIRRQGSKLIEDIGEDRNIAALKPNDEAACCGMFDAAGH